MSRIEARFAALKREGRAAFIPYVVAGDPDADASWRILEALPSSGADLIELGLPFSDPMADGPAVQRGARRALAAGADTAGVMALARRFREGDSTTPIILMGYYNPILTFGLAAFAEAASAAGIDGVIMVDVPPEEADPLADALEAQDVALIRLATPTTDPARMAIVVRRVRGFVYFVAVTGVTGGKEADATAIADHVRLTRESSGLPVAVGFGVRTPERAAEVARVADATVVGSALVDEISAALALKCDPAAKVLATAAVMSQAVRTARARG